MYEGIEASACANSFALTKLIPYNIIVGMAKEK